MSIEHGPQAFQLEFRESAIRTKNGIRLAFKAPTAEDLVEASLYTGGLSIVDIAKKRRINRSTAFRRVTRVGAKMRSHEEAARIMSPEKKRRMLAKWHSPEAERKIGAALRSRTNALVQRAWETGVIFELTGQQLRVISLSFPKNKNLESEDRPVKKGSRPSSLTYEEIAREIGVNDRKAVLDIKRSAIKEIKRLLRREARKSILSNKNPEVKKKRKASLGRSHGLDILKRVFGVKSEGELKAQLQRGHDMLRSIPKVTLWLQGQEPLVSEYLVSKTMRELGVSTKRHKTHS